MPNFSQSTSPPKSVRASDWTYQSSIGIDVHCKILVCCYQRLNPSDNSLIEERAEFPTGIQGIQKFAAWCVSKKPDIVMMESTGVLWNTPYEALEKAGFKSSQLALVNARDVKGRTGHKTDRNDAENLAMLARLNAFRKSFVPAREFRKIRLIARGYVTARRDFAKQKNRYQKTLNALGCRAGSVFSDIHGTTARMILHAFLFETKETFADVVREKSRRLKATPEQIFDALRNIDDPEMIWLAKTHFKEAEHLGKLCERYLAKLRNLLKPYKRHLDLLMSIPGINETAALLILAETGNDLSSFPSIEKFCSWIAVCPGNKISAGKSYSGHTARGNKYLRQVLTEVAQGISLSVKRKGFLWQKFQTWKEKRGTKRAVVATAHLVARIIFALFRKGQAYEERYTNILQQHRLKKIVRDARSAVILFKNSKVYDKNTGTVYSLRGLKTA